MLLDMLLILLFTQIFRFPFEAKLPCRRVKQREPSRIVDTPALSRVVELDVGGTVYKQ